MGGQLRGERALRRPGHHGAAPGTAAGRCDRHDRLDRGGQGIRSYGAAKAAIASWNIGLAREVGPAGLTANVVAPGYIARTEFFRDRLTDERRDGLVAATMTRRAGRPTTSPGRSRSWHPTVPARSPDRRSRSTAESGRAADRVSRTSALHAQHRADGTHLVGTPPRSGRQPVCRFVRAGGCGPGTRTCHLLPAHTSKGCHAGGEFLVLIQAF